ncbi:MAG: molybdopterin-dependent oxidoreductase, partial [Dehalococcoidia bacterium]|nr:molybdopterin-dependent oxidoreductase [Dehalococcoidia bacterium]
AAASDAGRAINPRLVQGQMEGGVGFGLGFALSEEVVFEKGKTLNPLLTDYRLSTSVDMPLVDAILLEEGKGGGPYGVLGVGETPNIPTGPAVANAIYNATGLRLQELPITPEKVRRALREKGERPAL